MRYSTRLKLENLAFMLGIYGGLTALLVYVGYRIHRGFSSGEITAGRHGEWSASVATEPYLFSFFVAMQVVVACGILGMIVYFAKEMRHGPFRRR